MDEDGPTPIMDEWYYAHRTCTSLLRGTIGDRVVAVKVWRGAHMRMNLRERFVQVSPSEAVSGSIDTDCKYELPSNCPESSIAGNACHTPTSRRSSA